MSSVILPLSSVIRIGTRKSPLALAQAYWVRDRLQRLHPHLAEEHAITIVPMMTSGDAMQAAPLAGAGGKGLFTKEIEEALLDGSIDIAVHSAKDMQTQLPDGLVLACCPEREDPRDVLIAPHAVSFEALPEGAVFGTSSLRRAAQALRLRPDLSIIPFRGNVQTRLRKMQEGYAQATMLAMAGLKRLKLDPLPGMVLPLEHFIPAVAQGALGVECRVADVRTQAWLAPLNHLPTLQAVTCERALLAAVDGSCRIPIAGYAEIRQGVLTLRAMLASNDAKQCWFAQQRGAVADAVLIGTLTGQELLRMKGL